MLTKNFDQNVLASLCNTRKIISWSLNHFSRVLHFIYKPVLWYAVPHKWVPVLWYAVPFKWVVFMWNATLDWNGLRPSLKFLRPCKCSKKKAGPNSYPFKRQSPKKSQTHSNNSSAIWRQIVWECLTILWY